MGHGDDLQAALARIAALELRVSELERLVIVTPPALKPPEPEPVDVAVPLRAALERMDPRARGRFLVAEVERVAITSPTRELVAIARRWIEGHATITELEHAEERAAELLSHATDAYNAGVTSETTEGFRLATQTWTLTVAIDPDLGPDSLDLVISAFDRLPGILDRALACC